MPDVSRPLLIEAYGSLSNLAYPLPDFDPGVHNPYCIAIRQTIRGDRIRLFVSNGHQWCEALYGRFYETTFPGSFRVDLRIEFTFGGPVTTVEVQIPDVAMAYDSEFQGRIVRPFPAPDRPAWVSNPPPEFTLNGQPLPVRDLGSYAIPESMRRVGVDEMRRATRGTYEFSAQFEFADPQALRRLQELARDGLKVINPGYQPRPAVDDGPVDDRNFDELAAQEPEGLPVFEEPIAGERQL